MSDRERTPSPDMDDDMPAENGANESPNVKREPRSRTRSRSRSARKKSYSRSKTRSRSGSRRRKRTTKSRSRSRSYSRGHRHSSRRSRRHTRSRSRSPRRRSRSDSRDRSRRRSYRSRSRSPRYGGGGGGGGGAGFGGGGPRFRGGGRFDNPPPSRCVGVFGLSLYTTERDLREYFGKFGPIEDVQLVYDHPSGRSRGFGFIYFESLDDSIEAKEQAAGVELDGHKIRVDFSTTKRAHTPTPGIYMGRPSMSNRRRGSDRGYGGGGGFRDDDYRGGARGRSPSPGGYRRGRSRSYSYSPRRDY